MDKDVRLAHLIPLPEDSLSPRFKSLSPGHFRYDRKSKTIYVRCSEGAISVSSLGLEGRKLMSGLEFFNGFMSKIGQAGWIFTTNC
jgi:methionyl-tRNA formyltransferase